VQIAGGSGSSDRAGALSGGRLPGGIGTAGASARIRSRTSGSGDQAVKPRGCIRVFPRAEASRVEACLKLGDVAGVAREQTSDLNVRVDEQAVKP
jgi:hypothetical protein